MFYKTCFIASACIVLACLLSLSPPRYKEVFWIAFDHKFVSRELSALLTYFCLIRWFLQFTTPGTVELLGFSIPKAKLQQFSSVLDRKLGGIKLPCMQWLCLGVISILEGVVLVSAVSCVLLVSRDFIFNYRIVAIWGEKKNASVCQLTHLRKVVALSSVLLWFPSKSD